jgi:hypothetical protein
VEAAKRAGMRSPGDAGRLAGALVMQRRVDVHRRWLEGLGKAAGREVR